ncbi:MAG: aldo/keto reductase [Deinococcota bacterium]
MRYVKLGNSGVRVSEVALGTMTFGEDWGWGASKAESQKMFTHYAEAGGNFIDTANNYTDGSSERFLADFLAADRDHFVVASKFTLSDNKSDLNFGGNHRKNLMRSLKASLERLGTDHLDLLWLHMWDFTTPVEEIMRALDDVVRMGLVHYIGFSDSPAWVTAQAQTLAQLRGWSPLIAIQLPYSLGSRHAERAHFPMAETLGLSVTAWGLLAGGLLTNKYAQAGDTPTRYDASSFSERWQKLATAVTEIAKDDLTGWENRENREWQ